MDQPPPPAAARTWRDSLRVTPRRTQPLVKAALWLALLLYAAVVVYVVFLARRRQALVWNPGLVNLVPLIHTIRDHDYIEGIGWWNYWSNIFGNVALLMPLPTLVASTTGLRSRRWLFAIGMAVSVLIETIQYVWHLGVPDVDDVIFNSMGVLLGVVLWELVFRKLHRRVAYQVLGARPA
ncbi:VanZ family protein [Hymenobacter caeli]|uniref:Glycopeptide antibiotics resistance protein n=1 Tax=Hymenobacter caeli TaxID=2735894 RepID=A0ABX2FND9_9BACT|nr:VanZ family protein [Hymenobacter caeli]NRT18691.1 glycopeptide antibiotics resistance protein [Hymenobacter caeli]